MSDITNIGVTGLIAFQSQMATTGHNISNSGTEGFHKQTTSLQSKPSILGTGGFIGTGVSIRDTSRAEDELGLKILNGHRTSETRYDTELSETEKITILVADKETGVLKAMDRYFNALKSLSNEPANLQNQSNFMSEAKALADQFASLDNSLISAVNDINLSTIDTINEINYLAQNIASLNRDIIISGSSISSRVGNDLVDQREVLISELSKIIAVTTIDNSDGSQNIFIGNGQSLVTGTNSTVLSTQLNSSDPTRLDITAKNYNETTQVITSAITGGRLGGLKEVRDNLIDPIQNKLNRIAITLSMTSNAQHKLGLNGNNTIGGNIFTDMNDISLQLSRSLSSGSNTGTADFAVTINEISRPKEGPYYIHSASSNIVDSGALGSLSTGTLTINGIAIRATTGADDALSPVTDAAASAIATSAAINASTSQTGVTATPEKNVLNLGTFTAGTFNAGEFQINGQSIVTTANTVSHLLQQINALTPTTGVRAVNDTGSNILLVADDGRNIQLDSNTNQPAATFLYFDTNSATALSKVQRASIELINQTNAITIAGNTPANVGMVAGSEPSSINETSLKDSEYELSYDGTNYKLTRINDNVVVYNSASSTIDVDGITIRLNSGSIVAGDKFKIKPNVGAARNLQLKLLSVKDIASASPISTAADPSNTGTGKIVRGQVIDTSGQPTPTATKYGNSFGTSGVLTPPIRIEFVNDSNGEPTLYRVFDVTDGTPGIQIGPDQSFSPNTSNEIFPISGVVDKSLPGPNASYTWDPGYRISINGAPTAGDVFTISYNADGVSDNTNLFELSKMRDEKLVKDDVATIQESYTRTVSVVTGKARSAKTNYEAVNVLRKQTESSYLSKVGVNLDEEAAELIRLRQAYNAAAQVVSVSSSLFDSLLAAVAR